MKFSFEATALAFLALFLTLKIEQSGGKPQSTHWWLMICQSWSGPALIYSMLFYFSPHGAFCTDIKLLRTWIHQDFNLPAPVVPGLSHFCSGFTLTPARYMHLFIYSLCCQPASSRLGSSEFLKGNRKWEINSNLDTPQGLLSFLRTILPNCTYITLPNTLWVLTTNWHVLTNSSHNTT